jgi:hypothetical protein
MGTARRPPVALGGGGVHDQRVVAPLPSVGDDLPGYLAEPLDRPRVDPVRMRDLLSGVHNGAHRLALALAESSVPSGAKVSSLASPRVASRQVPDLTAGFLRLVKVPGASLAATLDEWWSGASDEGFVVVDRRFLLGEPHGGQRAGWTMRGRVRRLRPIWVPVVVDVWAFNDRWTMMTMTPQARVLCSPRYFRTGHAVLDRLTAALSATSAGRAR